MTAIDTSGSPYDPICAGLWHHVGKHIIGEKKIPELDVIGKERPHRDTHMKTRWPLRCKRKFACLTIEQCACPNNSGRALFDVSDTQLYLA